MSGTATQAAVSGVATFSNLLLSAPGQVTLAARDPRGGADEQTFNLTVVPPPSCNFTYPANGATVSGRATMRGSATAGATPLRRVEYNLDGNGWMNCQGTEKWSFTVDASKLSEGRHIVQARAYDGTDYSETAALAFDVPASGGDLAWAYAVLVIVIVGAVCGLAVWWRARIR